MYSALFLDAIYLIKQETYEAISCSQHFNKLNLSSFDVVDCNITNKNRSVVTCLIYINY